MRLPVLTSHELETEHGWKGRHTTSPTTSQATATATTTTTSTILVGTNRTDTERPPEETMLDAKYLGHEPPHQTVALETAGVLQILQALSEKERQQLDRFDCTMPIRHLRAEKGHVPKALAQIKATLQWRKEFGVDVITSCFDVEHTPHDTEQHKQMRDTLSRECETGKVYVRGHTKADIVSGQRQQQRVCLLMTPARENTHNMIHNMSNLVFHLEKASAISKVRYGCEKIHILIDYENFKLKNAPPLSTSKYTLNILQKHYPERMQKCWLYHPPSVFTLFYNIIAPFVDATTKEKITIVTKKNLSSFEDAFDGDSMEERHCGTAAKPFDSADYLRLPFDQPYG